MQARVCAARRHLKILTASKIDESTNGETYVINQEEDSGNKFGDRFYVHHESWNMTMMVKLLTYYFVAQSGGDLSSRSRIGIPGGTFGRGTFTRVFRYLCPIWSVGSKSYTDDTHSEGKKHDKKSDDDNNHGKKLGSFLPETGRVHHES